MWIELLLKKRSSYEYDGITVSNLIDYYFIKQKIKKSVCIGIFYVYLLHIIYEVEQARKISNLLPFCDKSELSISSAISLCLSILET